MQNNQEQELITRSLRGDHAAYAEIVDRYKNAVYHHCFAIVRNEDAAEDVAQEAFIAAYYKLALYNPAFRLSTWLFKIATNKALDHLKKAKREVRADAALLEQVASSHKGPHQIALDAELHAAVGKLPPKYCALISLHYWQGLPYDEIARVMDVPQGSVKGWMRRAKDQLKKELS